MSPLGIPFTLSIALGLAAFALVELNGSAPIWRPCAASSSPALAHVRDDLAIGVLVYLLVDRSRRREVWIALVPLTLFVAWWVWARQFDQAHHG